MRAAAQAAADRLFFPKSAFGSDPDAVIKYDAFRNPFPPPSHDLSE
jgi:hypothetical protein